MTEAEWLTGGDPEPLLECLRDRGGDEDDVSERKLMLFAVACCNRLPVGSLTPRLVVEFNMLEAALWHLEGGSSLRVAGGLPGYDCRDAQDIAAATSNRADNGYGDGRAQSDLIRCIFGNPFRNVNVDPDWRTSTAVALATGIYADQAFDRLPVLADALEDAGCDDADVLGHCRSEGPHVRGCWVVDLLAGKA